MSISDEIRRYQDKHPADPGYCPVCWHRYGRAIPLSPSKCFACGTASMPVPATPLVIIEEIEL